MPFARSPPVFHFVISCFRASIPNSIRQLAPFSLRSTSRSPLASPRSAHCVPPARLEAFMKIYRRCRRAEGARGDSRLAQMRDKSFLYSARSRVLFEKFLAAIHAHRAAPLVGRAARFGHQFGGSLRKWGGRFCKSSKVASRQACRTACRRAN